MAIPQIDPHSYTLRHKIEICLHVGRGEHEGVRCLAFLNETDWTWQCVDYFLFAPRNDTLCGTGHITVLLYRKLTNLSSSTGNTPHLTTFAVVSGASLGSPSPQEEDSTHDRAWLPIVAGCLVGLVAILTVAVMLYAWRNRTWARGVHRVDDEEFALTEFHQTGQSSTPLVRHNSWDVNSTHKEPGDKRRNPLYE